MKNKKMGITLSVLVITILLLFILAGVGISILINKQYFEKADYANFQLNFDNYKSELEDYIGNQEFLTSLKYKSEKLFADKNGIYYDNTKLETGNIKDIIPSLNDKYINDLKIYKGDLIYVGEQTEYKESNFSLVSNQLLQNLNKENANLNSAEITVSAEIEGDFSLEMVFVEKNNSYNSGINNLIVSDGFLLYEKNSNHDLYLGLNDSYGKDVAVSLNEDKFNKITYTFNSNTLKGALYVNSVKVDEIEYLELNSFDSFKIYGIRDYYNIRVYNKCLNLSEIKQNDFYDIMTYGNWGE